MSADLSRAVTLFHDLDQRRKRNEMTTAEMLAAIIADQRPPAPTPSGGDAAGLTADDAHAAQQFAEGCRRQAAFYQQRDPSEAPWFKDLAELLTRMSAALLAARRGEERYQRGLASVHASVMRAVAELEAENQHNRPLWVVRVRQMLNEAHCAAIDAALATTPEGP